MNNLKTINEITEEVSYALSAPVAKNYQNLMLKRKYAQAKKLIKRECSILTDEEIDILIKEDTKLFNGARITGFAEIASTAVEYYDTNKGFDSNKMDKYPEYLVRRGNLIFMSRAILMRGETEPEFYNNGEYVSIHEMDQIFKIAFKDENV